MRSMAPGTTTTTLARTVASDEQQWPRDNIYKARMPAKGMQIDISGALRDLAKVADRIAELLEWEKLAQQERRPHVPPAFQLCDHNRKDIIDLYSWFLNLSMSAHEVLDSSDFEIPEEQRGRWQRRLRELEKRVDDCRIIDRFIKP